MTFARYFKFSSYCLIGSGFLATAATGVADIFSICIFASVFVCSWFVDTIRLRRAIPSRVFPIVAAAYLIFVPIDFTFLSRSLPLTFLHLLLFATGAKLLTRASDRDHRQLYLLSLAELVLAAAITANMAFIFCFLAFIFSGLSTLVLFEMLQSNARMRHQARVLPLVARKNGLEPGLELFSPFPPGIFSAVMIGMAVLVLAGAIPMFFLLPRLSLGAHRQPSGATQFVSGFAERIELGRMGTIRQSDAVVMKIKTDAPPERLSHDGKWRGLSFDYYDGRAWKRSRQARQDIPTQGGFYKLETSAQGSSLIRQIFFVEALSTNVIFAANRPLAISRDVGFLQRDSAGNLFAASHLQNKLRYIAVSDPVLPDPANISDLRNIPQEILETYLQLPPLDPRIEKLAKTVTRGFEGRYAKARALEEYLRSHYAYSLTLQGASHSQDPLAMFLFEARAGHCEYFASALTIMLRQLGIPARIVNGFRSGEYNPLGDSWTVRRHHAHSWTEAYFPPYGWIELDSTPTRQPHFQTAIARFISNLTDAVGLWWWEGVVSYDSSKQYRVVSGLFAKIDAIQNSLIGLITTAQKKLRLEGEKLLSPGSRMELTKTWLFWMPGLMILALLLIQPIRRRIFKRIRHLRLRNNARTAAISYYEEALEMLQSHGLNRRKEQTPMEFAQSLGLHPAGPFFLSLTRLYNASRFGGPDFDFPQSEAQILLRSLRNSLQNQFPRSRNNI